MHARTAVRTIARIVCTIAVLTGVLLAYLGVMFLLAAHSGGKDAGLNRNAGIVVLLIAGAMAGAGILAYVKGSASERPRH
jgi:hypothetical protein